MSQSTKPLRVLNAFCCFGGNRRDWPANVEVTGVEYNQEIADHYQRHFPNDTVVVADAYEYVRKNWHKFDFIWASPSCITHSKMRFISSKRGSYDAVLPDMRLWAMIIFLNEFTQNRNINFVVENVNVYYQKFLVNNVSKEYAPFIQPTVKLGRHCFWTNFPVEEKTFKSKGSHTARGYANSGPFALKDIRLKTARKDQMIRKLK
jgi:DNA (cytosine-5)-methyltransferase 1